MTAKNCDRFFWMCLATATLIALIGCTAAEVHDGLNNAGSSAVDAVTTVLTHPETAFTPAGLLTLIGVFATGFVGREAASLSKSAASGTGGWLANTYVKFFPKPPTKEAP